MDVRAPIEFRSGTFPNATNLPILDDQQREKTGIFYKRYGQDRAVQKAHELVHGKLREQRVAAWLEFSKRNPDACLYCFRGGLRSKIARQWMHDAGTDMPLIIGGYKALRACLLQELENAIQYFGFKLVGGKTGCAKTTLINALENGIDLEAAAYHRGSTFGKHAVEQNNQVNFENSLAISCLKLRNAKTKNIILEDEARTIGKVGLPKSLFKKMRSSSIVVIEEPFEARLERLLQEYVIEMLAEFQQQYETDAFSQFSAYLLQSLEKIQKRLGPVRFETIRNSMQQALSRHQKANNTAGHYDWIKIILENYYDPMYEDQLKNREEYICFRGDYNDCKAYLEHAQ